ncbi:MAG: hypothetical protein ABJL44_04985 [Algibacter sp.]
MNKKIIYVLLFVLSITSTIIAQNNLFDNISTTDQYTEYSSVQSAGEDGNYIIKNKYAIVKFHKEYLPTGEGYKIKIIVDNEGKYKGKTRFLLDVTTEEFACKGQPYESFLINSKQYKSFVAIDDYVFVLYGAQDDGVSFTKIDRVFIKNRATVQKNDGKKKKPSFKDRLLALKATKAGGGNFGAEHKALQSQNLNKLIIDYLVAMKAKQDTRTPAELIKEKNVEIAKKKRIAKDIQDEKDEWAEAKRYNDSIRATPEHQDLERRKRQNEANYQAAQNADVVTLRNNSSSSVYVGKSGSVNRGTKISAGGTAKWNCHYDAYIQRHTIEGGSNAYRSTSTKVYSKNIGCGKTININ